MSSSESDSEYESPSTGGSKVRCFESSKDYTLWSKRIMNHLMGAGLESAIIPSDESKATTPSAKAIERGLRINQKAYTFIYARLHDNVLIELSPEVSNPAKPNAMALWQELGEEYGGGAMHELVSTIDVIHSTRVGEGEDPRKKLNDMRSAYLKLNANSIPLDDKFFALIILKALPETTAATVQVLFGQPDLSSTKVITSACNYWNLKTKTKEDKSTVAFTARKNLNKNTNRNTGFVNSNPPDTFHCIYHPGANSHNTIDCRKAKQMAQSAGRNTQSGNVATAHIATMEDVMSYATAFIAGQKRTGRETEFHLDSGASGHLTCNKELLVNPVPYRSAVTIGDGSQLYSTHKGSIHVTDTFKVDNALYVPGLACNLLSVRELLSGNFNVRFDKDEAVIRNETSQSVLGTAAFERQNGTYTLRASPSIPSAMLATSTDYVLNWHNRLGHLHFGEVVRLGKAGWLEKDWETKYTFANVKSDGYLCEPCILGKGARLASPNTILGRPAGAGLFWAHPSRTDFQISSPPKRGHDLWPLRRHLSENCLANQFSTRLAPKI